MASQGLNGIASTASGPLQVIYQADRSEIATMFREANDLVIRVSNGSTSRFQGFFAHAEGGTIVLQESDGSLWQALFAQEGGQTVMQGFIPYEADAALLESLPARTVFVDPDNAWDGYSIEIQGYTDNVGWKQGEYGERITTDDPTPRLHGVVEGLKPGDQVQIYRGEDFLGVANVDAEGKWFFDVPTTTDGHHTFAARIVNSSGLQSDVFSNFVMYVDTASYPLFSWILLGLGVATALAFIFAGNSSKSSSPKPPEQTVTIDHAVDDEEPQIGDILTGGNTNDQSLTLHGTLSSALNSGESLVIFRDGVEVGRLEADALGDSLSWSFTDDLTEDGSYTYTACVQKSGGLSGALSNEFAVTLDTGFPVVGVAISQIVDDTSGQDVVVAKGGYTEDDTPTLSGTVNVNNIDDIGSGEYIEILRNGARVGTITLDTLSWNNNVANWTFTDDLTGETDGQYIYTARVVDLAGNQGAVSQSYELNLLTASPTVTATLLQIVDDVGLSTGPIADGATTDDGTPTLHGTVSQALASHEELVIYRQTNGGVAEEVARLTLSSTSWQYTDSGLRDGNSYTYYAQVENPSGLAGTASTPHTIRFATDVKVTAEITNVIDDVAPVTGTVAKNTWTNDGELDLEGTISTALAADEALYVYRLDVASGTQVLVGSATVTGTDWTLTDQSGSMVDTHTYTYTAVVVNTGTQAQGAVSTGWTVKYDGSAATHTVTIDGIEDNVGTVTGFFPDSPLRSDDDTPELKGTVTGLNTAISEEVHIYRTDASTGTEVLAGVASVDSQGNWTFTDGSLNNLETYTYVARVVKQTGEQSADSNAFEMTLDKTNASYTEILQIFNDDGATHILIARDGWTNDTSPLLRGSISSPLTSADEVIIYRDGVAVGTAKMTGATTWEWSDAGLEDGKSYVYHAQVEGTVLRGMSRPYVINVDTSDPTQTVTITSVIDNVLPNPGDVNEYLVGKGESTNDTTPMLVGTLDTALASNGTEAVHIYRDGSWVGTATLTGATTWTFTDSLVGQSDATYTYTARVEDKAGNQGNFSDPYAIDLLTAKPTQTVTIDKLYDDASPGVGDVFDGESTNDTTPLLSGTITGTLDSGDTVVIYRLDPGASTPTYLGTAIVSGNTWEFSDDLGQGSSYLGDGDYTYTAYVRNASEILGDPSSSFTVDVDTSFPVVGVAITQIVDDTGAQDVIVAKDGYTKDATPTLTGTLTVGNISDIGPGEYLEILRNGASVGTITLDTVSWNNNVANWTFTDDLTGETDGQYIYTARVVDSADNQGAVSTPYTMNLLTMPPTPSVTLTQIYDDAGLSTGPIPNNTTTDDSTPTLHGTISDPLLSYEELVIYRQTNGGAAEEVARLRLETDSWQYTDSGLSDGNSYTYYAQVENASGLTGGPSNSHTIHFETDVKVTAEITNVIDDVAPVTGTVAKNTWTDDGELDLEGTISTTLAANEAVYVYRLDVSSNTNTLVGSAAVTGTDWTLTDQLGNMVDTRSYIYTAVVINTDTLVEGAVSTSWTVKYDGAAATHTVTIEGIYDNAGTVTGFFTDSPLRSDDDTPELRGTVSSLNTAIGEQLWIYRTDTTTGTELAVGTAAVDASGNWTYTDGSLNNLETYTYVARVVKQTGQESADSNTFEMTLDKTSVDTTEILQIYNDDGASLALIGKDGWTNDVDPLIRGSIASPLTGTAEVIIYRDGIGVGTATMTSATTWEWSDSSLQDGGPYIYTAQIEVPGGAAIGGLSSPYAINVDTGNPQQVVTITSVIDDLPPNPGGVSDYVVTNGGTTNDTTPRLVGTLDSALASNGTETVHIYRDGHWAGTVTMTGTTTWTFTDSLVGQSDKTYTYTARVEDKAGNQGNFSDPYAIELLTANPAQSVTIDKLYDDVSPAIGDVFDGESTNDTTPLLSGTITGTLDTGDVVVVYRLNPGASTPTYLGTATVSGNTWEFQDDLGQDSSYLGDGTYTYTAYVRNASDILGTASNSFSVDVDTSFPVVGVSIREIVDDTSGQDVVVAKGGYTKDATPTLSGTVNVNNTDDIGLGEYIEILRNGAQVGTITLDTTQPGWQNWTFTDDLTGETDGQYIYTARVVDLAANQGAASQPYELNLLTTPPTSSVTLTQIYDDYGLLTGPIADGADTDDSTPTVQGTVSDQLAGYEELVVYRQTNGGTAEEVARLTLTGTSWEYTDSGLSDGNSYTYYAQVENKSGLAGTPSTGHTINFVTNVKVTAEITNVIDDMAPVTGTVAKNAWTDDGELDLEGTISTALASNEAVYVYRLDVTGGTNVLVGSATVTGTNWTITDQSGGMVDTRSYTYTAVVVNTDTQIEGAVSTGWTVKYDGAAATHTVTIDGIEDNVGTVTGFFPDSPLRSDDDTPELHGTVTGLNTAIGEEVWIFRTDMSTGTEVKVGVADVDALGNWTYTDGSLNNLETYTYVARVVKPTGQQSADSNAFEMTLDKTNAGATEVLQIFDDDGAAQLLIGKDGWTNDISPLLKGSISSPLTSADKVIIYRDGVAVGMATMTGATTWEFSDAGLEDGERYVYQAQVEGTTLGGMSSGYAINVDTSEPTQVVTISSVIDNVLPNPGGVADYIVPDGQATNDTTPTLTGTLDIALAANGTETVNIYRDGDWVGTATVDGQTWTFTDSLVGQPDGAYTYTARVEDRAGNRGDFSNSYTIVLDATVPAQEVTITEVVDDKAPVTGTVDNGDPTNDYTPTLNGTLDGRLAAGEEVVIFRQLGSGSFVEVGTATVTDTDWTFTDNLEHPTNTGKGLDGIYTYKAVVRDAASNTSSDSNTYAIELDTTVPQVGVTITHVYDDETPYIGNVSHNGYTNDLSPEIVGTLQSGPLAAGEYVVVLRDGEIIGTATVAGNGVDWRFEDDGTHAKGAVVDGEKYTYTAYVKDAAGNEAGISNGFVLNIDATDPAQTVEIWIMNDNGESEVPIADNGLTSDNSPKIYGTLGGLLAGNEVVAIYRSDGTTEERVTTLTTNSTSWNWNDSGLAAGTLYTYRARVEDASSNTSGWSNTHSLQVETTPVPHIVAITDVYDDFEPVTGTVANGKTTNDTTPTLSGTLDQVLDGAQGEQVIVYRDGSAIGTAVTTGLTWTYEDTGLVHGETYTYSAKVINSSSEESNPSNNWTITIDTEAPTQDVTIDYIADDFGDMTEDLQNGDRTDDQTPTLHGSLDVGLGAGEVVVIYRQDVKDTTIAYREIGTASVTGTDWEYEDASLIDGTTYTYVAYVKDAAGNLSVASNDFAITIDISTGQTVTIQYVMDDVDPQTGDIGRGGYTNDTEPEVRGYIRESLASGEQVVVYRDGVKIGIATITGTTGWFFNDSGLSDAESYTYTARVEMTSGTPRSDYSSGYTIHVDATDPTQTVTISTVVDDAPPNPGGAAEYEVPHQGTTNDTTPTLKGTIVGTLGATEFVAIYRDDVQIGTASVTGQNWTFTDTLTTNDTYTYTARVKDQAGNVGAASDAYIIKLDTTVPAQLVTIDGIVDNELPNPVGMADSYTLANGDTTNDTTPTINGHLDQALGTDETIVIFRQKLNGDAEEIGTVTATTGATFDWTYTDTIPGTAGYGDGEYTYWAVVRDAAHLTSAKSNDYTIVLDTEAPDPTTKVVEITGIDPDTGSDTNDGVTDDGELIVSGTLKDDNGDPITLPADEWVEVRILDSTGTTEVLGWQKATMTGSNWEFDGTRVITLQPGDYTYEARIVDSGANQGSTDTYDVTIVPPSGDNAIRILAMVDDTGIPEDFVTTDTTPLLSGEIESPLNAVERVQIRIMDSTGQTEIMTWTDALVSGTDWAYQHTTATEIADGTYRYEARIIDGAGATVASTYREITIDTIPPDDKQSLITGIEVDTGLVGDYVTSEADLKVHGDVKDAAGTTAIALPDNERVQLQILDANQNEVLGWTDVAMNQARNGWTYDGTVTGTPLGLDEGTYTFKVRVIDEAGNDGNIVNSQVVTIDITPPDSTISAVITAIDEDTGTVGDFITSDTLLIVSGEIQDQSGSVTALADGERVQIMIEDSAGQEILAWTDAVMTGDRKGWSFDGTDTGHNILLANGTYTYSVRVIDTADNVGNVTTKDITIDTAPPAQGSEILITHIVTDTGDSDSDFITNESPYVVHGTLLDTNDNPVTLGTDNIIQIRVHDGTDWSAWTNISSSYNTTTGTWSFADQERTASGEYTYQVRVYKTSTGAAGSADDQIVTLDLILSPITGEIDGITTDTTPYLDKDYISTPSNIDDLETDFITRDPTLTVTGTLTGTLGADERLEIQITDNSGPSGWLEVTDINAATGAWTYQDADRDGALTYELRLIDTAGNKRILDTRTDVTIDLDAPLMTIAPPMLDSARDSGTKGDFTTTETSHTFTDAQHGLAQAGTWIGLVEDANNDGIYQQGVDVILGSAVVAADGTWSIDNITFAEGKHHIGFVLWDTAGNYSRLGLTTELDIVSKDIAATAQDAWSNANTTVTNAGAAVSLDENGMYVFYNNQNVTAQTETGYDPVSLPAPISASGAPVNATLVDYDRSGYASIFANDATANAVQTAWLNNNGTYTSSTVAWSGTGPVNGGVIAIDADGDGYVDLAYGTGATGTVAALRAQAGLVMNNNGSGWTVNSGGGVPGETATLVREISGVDINNDGKVDIVAHTNNSTAVTAVAGDSTLTILQNNGGTFSARQTLDGVFTIGTANAATSMTWADFNGDGYMDLYLNSGRNASNNANSEESRIYFNTGKGTLQMMPTYVTGSTTAISDIAGTLSLATDWNHDGSMDVIEIASTAAVATSSINLYINGGSGRAWTSAQLGSITTVTGAVLADTNWDGALDLVLTRSGSNANQVILNTEAVKEGTSLHLKIVDGDGLNVYYGNTVQLYDAGGNLIGTQILNSQSGIGTNDSTGMVHFYNLHPTETYTVKMYTAGGEVTWDDVTTDGLSYVLSTAAADDATFTGTGYNDTFIVVASTTNVTYNGGGGWTEPADATGTSWVADGGMDIVDFKNVTAGVSVDLDNTGSQNTGVNTATFTNIEGLRGGSGDDVFTDNALDNLFEGRGGDDTFNLVNGGHDTLVYRTLDGYENDARGGNGEDAVSDFTLGDLGDAADTNADVIDLRDLLSNYLGTATVYWDADAGGAGVGGYLLDYASRPLEEFFLNVELDGSGNTLIQVDRNGGGQFETVLVLEGVETDLATLLVNNQLLVASSSSSEAVTINRVHVYEGNTIILTGTAPANVEAGAEMVVIVDGTTYDGSDIVLDPVNHTWSLTLSAAAAAGLVAGTYDVMAMMRLTDGRMVGQDYTRNELVIEAIPETGSHVTGENMSIQGSGMTVGDISGDGLWDYYSGNGVYAQVATNEFNFTVFNGLILFTRSAGASTYGIQMVDSVSFVDMEGNGLPHIMLHESAFSDGTSYFYNESEEGILEFRQVDPGTYGAGIWHGGVVAIDLNGNGLLDLVYGDRAYDDGIYWVNQGNGVYKVCDTLYPASGVNGYGPTSSNGVAAYCIGDTVGAFDMNGDGRVDLLGNIGGTITLTDLYIRLAGVDGQGNQISPLLATSGSGNYFYHAAVYTRASGGSAVNYYQSSVQSVAVADFNGDGILDLFTGQSAASSNSTTAYAASRVYFGLGDGDINVTTSAVGTTPGYVQFDDRVYGGVLLPVDWDLDGQMDIFEFAANDQNSGAASGVLDDSATLTANKTYTLWTNTTTDSSSPSFTQSQYNVATDYGEDKSIISAISADFDYDGARDLIINANDSDIFVRNTNTIDEGTCIHLKIVNPQGINAFMSYTVKLYDEDGNLVATRVLNPQYGYGTNDQTGIVDFYGLDQDKTYSAVLIKVDGNDNGNYVNGGYHSIIGDASLAGTLASGTQYTVNTGWSGLIAGNGKDATYVLSAESGTDATTHNGSFVGTGYNDTFIATDGNDSYNGSGGWSFYGAPEGHWSNTGGVDIIDYQLFSFGMTFNMAEGKTYLNSSEKDTFINVEGIAGTSGNDTFITDGKTNNFFEGRGGDDIFQLANGGNDTLVYKLLTTTADDGGNGHDQVYDFKVGLFVATPDADRIDLSDLLHLDTQPGFTGSEATTTASYVDGVAELNPNIGNIEDYLQVSFSPGTGNTTISVDLNGTGAYTDIITLNGTQTDLATLLTNEQLVLF